MPAQKVLSQQAKKYKYKYNIQKVKKLGLSFIKIVSKIILMLILLHSQNIMFKNVVRENIKKNAKHELNFFKNL